MKNLSLKEKSVIQLIKSKESYANYFFGKYDKAKLFDEFKNQGFFAPNNNPSPKKVKDGYQIPDWNVLQYLEKLSHKTRKLDEELLEIIEEVSLYKKDGKHIDNYRTWWYFVKILLNIPLSQVPYKIFDEAMPVWLDSKFNLTLPGADLTDDLLPSYLAQINSTDDVKKVERLIDAILDVKDLKVKKSTLGNTIDVETRIDTHWLEECFVTKNNSQLIAQKCTNSPIFNLSNKIKMIFNKKYKDDDYSYIWLRDLTKDESKSIYNPEHFLAVILRQLAIEKVKHNKEEGMEVIQKFLSDEYPHSLFKRLAMVLISMDWENYAKYFDLILGDIKERYFDRDAFRPELAHLLRQNSNELTQKQKNKILEIIDNGPSEDLPDNKKEEYKLYWKQSIYKILDTNPEFKSKYDEIKKITKRDVKLPEYNNGVILKEEFDKSPVSAEEFLTKENGEIVRYVTTYKPTGHFPNFSPEGIYRTLQSAVELNPSKFTQSLSPFKTKDYHLLLSLYNGLEEAWKQHRDISWDEVVKFTFELLQEDWFWKPPEKDKIHYQNYFSWTLSAIGDLLREGCRTDDWSFNESLHKDIEMIIDIMIDKLPYDSETYNGAGVDHALNSSWGKVLTAIIYLGLREARLSDKNKEKKTSKWSKSLKDNFESALGRDILEAYTLLGQYLPNLHYIDKEWVENKAKSIHAIDDKRFETFMEGYLFTGKVYEKLYKLLTKSYEKALAVKFEDKRIQERLIQHITVGYVRGNEGLGDDSLIDKIIKTGNSEYVREIVEFMWHQKDYIIFEKSQDKAVKKEQEEFKTRIINFWDYILNLFSKKKVLTLDDKKVLSELGKFAIYLPNLDEAGHRRLLASAPFVTIDFDSPYFIEYLNEIKNKGNKEKAAKYIGTLYLKMLEGADGLIPDYKWENIVEIITFLYEIGKKDKEVKELANQICVFYAEHQNLRLRSLYEKNNGVSQK